MRRFVSFMVLSLMVSWAILLLTACTSDNKSEFVNCENSEKQITANTSYTFFTNGHTLYVPFGQSFYCTMGPYPTFKVIAEKNEHVLIEFVGNEGAVSEDNAIRVCPYGMRTVMPTEKFRNEAGINKFSVREWCYHRQIEKVFINIK